MKKLAYISMLFTLLLSAYGCKSVFYRQVDGQQIVIGVPVSQDGQITLDVLEYLSGETVTVAKPSTITHSFTNTVSNSYFGCIHIKETKVANIKVTPEVTNDGKQSN